MYQEQTNNNFNQNKDNNNPYTIIVNKVEPYTQFLDYVKNVDILEFALKFYNTDKLDNNIQENIRLMKNDFGRFPRVFAHGHRCLQRRAQSPAQMAQRAHAGGRYLDRMHPVH